MTLGSALPLTEMTTRYISRWRKATSAYGWKRYHLHVPKIWEYRKRQLPRALRGLTRPVMGLLYLYLNSVHSDYKLITNLVHWLLFIHKILFSSTCFEHQVLIFRRKQLYTCSIWYCHSLWEFLVACRYTAWVRTDCRGKVVGRAS